MMRLSGLWKLFVIDTRALAVFRISLALVMLVDVFGHLTQLLDFYTDSGFCPRSAFPGGSHLSLYFLSGSQTFVVALLWVHIAFTVALLIGYRTRLATIGCVVMTMSLVTRNPLLTNSGDSLVLWFLIWSIFLPLGARASVDSRTSRQPAPPTVCNIASAAVLLQVVYLYLGAGTAKNTPLWLSDFSAVHTILSSHLGTPFGLELAQWPIVTKLITMATLFMELIGALVALCTMPFPRIRTLMVVLFLLFHLGLTMSVYVGPFSFYTMSGWLVFIPPAAWDFLDRISAWNILKRAWGRIINAIAGGIEALARIVPLIASRSIASIPLNPALTVLVALMLGYVTLVNAATDALYVLHHGPPRMLPAVKQVWGVMAELPQGAQWNLIQVKFDDGSTDTLAMSDAIARMNHRPLIEYLICPENGRLPTFHQRMQYQAYHGQFEVVDSYCRHYLELAKKRYPGRHIVSINAYIYFRETPLIDATAPPSTQPVMIPIYTLKADSNSSTA